MNSSDLDRSIVETAYARWAPIYDAVCGPVMVKGRRAAAAAARAIGGRILEVGVGTGLSFDDYDVTTEITGIDLSAPMLAKAREKMASGRYPYVKDVQLMDAHQMSVCRRHVRLRGGAVRHHAGGQSRAGAFRMPPRGEARRADHSGQSSLFGNRRRRGGRALGRAGAPARSACGPEFPFARLQAWAQANKDANLVERRKVAPFGIYTLVCFERTVPSAA